VAWPEPSMVQGRYHGRNHRHHADQEVSGHGLSRHHPQRRNPQVLQVSDVLDEYTSADVFHVS
jgi:hypothetical protein